MDSKLKGNAI